MNPCPPKQIPCPQIFNHNNCLLRSFIWFNQQRLTWINNLTSKSAVNDDGLGLNGPYSGPGYLGVGTAANSQSTSVSVWGRIGSSKSKLDVKEKIDPANNSSDCIESETKEGKEALVSIQHPPRQGKRIMAEDGPKAMDSSPKTHFDPTRNIRKPSQKALRTLFVNGIPQKSNKREALLSHFQKFGEVIDIYIPLNSERAFVQFSRRKEAETALKAPDAVMGNRFIKLWWANRDSIPDVILPSQCTLCTLSIYPSYLRREYCGFS
ncbi:hypothetical protein L3X38_020482 [Prunus dulcis]|uniref:RRM domain-containing protein n=1 Tax=Prunus dulcis TaxID=3755 RepID=A0AAD4WD00_PRUDU|nr:hypothetical protein L3X38_020482 [Prunus dulcis]